MRCSRSSTSCRPRPRARRWSTTSQAAPGSLPRNGSNARCAARLRSRCRCPSTSSTDGDDVRLNRRQFLRGAGSAALLASGHVLALVPRRARAALPVNPVVVLGQLSGGNDALKHVLPVNTLGGAQRSLYDAYRPSLRVPPSSLAATLLGADPVGTGLAFHPVMTELK